MHDVGCKCFSNGSRVVANQSRIMLVQGLNDAVLGLVTFAPVLRLTRI